MKKQKIWFLILLIGMISLMSACSKEPITVNSPGFWDHFFVYPFSWFIQKTASIVYDNYGIAIILVTLIIKTILIPVSSKQLKSSLIMKKLSPQINALREKYSNKDQETMAKLYEETMKLYRDHGTHPFAGCLPMLIQFPIFLAFYHAITRTGEIASHSFLWFELGIPDPFYALAIIAALTTFMQVKLTGNVDESNPISKKLVFIAPVMVLFSGSMFPTALVLYWIIGNIYGIIQFLILQQLYQKEQN